MLVYPGAAGDVWELSFSGGPAWSHIVPSGAVPPPRNGHSAIYDPVRDRMIVFGGVDGSTYRNDAWALSLSGSPRGARSFRRGPIAGRAHPSHRGVRRRARPHDRFRGSEHEHAA